MTNNLSAFDIDDSCVVLPDLTWVRIFQARQRATDPAHIAKLTDRLYDWVGATGRVGTAVDDRDSLGLFTEVLEFETPDFDLVPVPAYRAELLATKYQQLFGLNVERLSEGRYRVEMSDWHRF